MSPVRVERMINSRRAHTVHEPVPFQAAPLTTCGQHGVCLGEKACADVDCDNHPDNDIEPMADEWAGAVLNTTKAVWCFIAVLVLAMFAIIALAAYPV